MKKKIEREPWEPDFSEPWPGEAEMLELFPWEIELRERLKADCERDRIQLREMDLLFESYLGRNV